MSFPAAAVAPPGGRPLPSGAMSMSIARISAGEAARPTPNVGDCDAIATPTDRATRTRAVVPRVSGRSRLRAIAIGDLSVGRDLPRLDPVVVIVRVHAANLDQFGDGRLRITGVVGASRGDHRLAAVPVPRPAEARV